MIVVRLMGALLTPKQPRFYTGRHRARLRQATAEPARYPAS